MSINTLNAANDNMMMLMQILMKGMNQGAELSKKMLAVNLENTVIGEKMATAQNIIDVYA